MNEVEPTPEEIAAIEAARADAVISVMDDQGRFVPLDSNGKPIPFEFFEEYAKRCLPVNDWDEVELEILNGSIDWDAVKAKAEANTAAMRRDR